MGLLATILQGGQIMQSIYQSARSWDFCRAGDTKGWTIPEPLTGVAAGGALWLTNASGEIPYEKSIKHAQMFAGKSYEIASPSGLGIPAQSVGKVRLRVRNLSPETDGFVRWTAKHPEAGGSRRFTMQPFSHEWQDVVCHVDGGWIGEIDQIFLTMGVLGRFGDIWIERIEIADGPLKLPNARPDLNGPTVVPLIQLPGIAQQQFQEAFDVLDECLVTDVPVAGFDHPFLAPGGAYGPNWWQLDSSLSAMGAKWADPCFAEGVIRGFVAVQEMNPDGRIDLWGGSPIRGATGDLSSVPRYFEAAYDMAKRTADREWLATIYRSMDRYLQWWLSPVKRDVRTGLVTGFSEETLGGFDPGPSQIAAMDLNVAVAVGCACAADLAGRLGQPREAERHRETFEWLREAINRYLWNEELGAYYSYNVVTGVQQTDLICTIFDAFRLGIAPSDRTERLLSKLLDPALFNWGKIGLTSVARTDPNYCEATGVYDGTAWFGNIWTMRNLPIICGLEDIGRHDLAAELAWMTIRLFNGTYTEYLEPTRGEGHGVEKYGWSASQYVEAIIAHLFGIDYDRQRSQLRITPRIPSELHGEFLSIKGLIMTTAPEARLDLIVMEAMNGEMTVELRLTGNWESTTQVRIARSAIEGETVHEENLMSGRSITVRFANEGSSVRPDAGMSGV